MYGHFYAEFKWIRKSVRLSQPEFPWDTILIWSHFRSIADPDFPIYQLAQGIAVECTRILKQMILAWTKQDGNHIVPLRHVVRRAEYPPPPLTPKPG